MVSLHCECSSCTEFYVNFTYRNGLNGKFHYNTCNKIYLAQLCKKKKNTVIYEKNQIRHLKWVKCMVCEFYLNRNFFFFLIFWLHHMACGLLVPRPGMEPAPPALEA